MARMYIFFLKAESNQTNVYRDLKIQKNRQINRDPTTF